MCYLRTHEIYHPVTQMEKQDDIYNNMASEHFINATDSFYEYLGVLFSKCLLPGNMPAALVLSTFIPKDNNNMHNADKYRGIALILSSLEAYLCSTRWHSNL